MAFHISLSLPWLPCARQDTQALHAQEARLWMWLAIVL